MGMTKGSSNAPGRVNFGSKEGLAREERGVLRAAGQDNFLEAIDGEDGKVRNSQARIIIIY